MPNADFKKGSTVQINIIIFMNKLLQLNTIYQSVVLDLKTNWEIFSKFYGLLRISEHNNAKFLGINRLWNDGVFVYNSGGNVNYTNWRIGEPDNTGDCVELQKV